MTKSEALDKLFDITKDQATRIDQLEEQVKALSVQPNAFAGTTPPGFHESQLPGTWNTEHHNDPKYPEIKPYTGTGRVVRKHQEDKANYPGQGRL